MNTPLKLLNSTAVETWVLSLLHSVWLGLVWVILLWAVLKFLPAKRSRLRYVVSCAALLGLLASALVTCSLLRLPARSEAALRTVESVPTEIPATASSSLETTRRTDGEETAQANDSARVAFGFEGADLLPLLAVVWIIGCLLMLFRTSRRPGRCPLAPGRKCL